MTNEPTIEPSTHDEWAASVLSGGPMVQAVLADIAVLKPDVVRKRQTYRQLALVLAGHIDAYSREATVAADLSAIARAISELRTVMDRLTGVASDDDDEGKQLGIPRRSGQSAVPAAVRDEAQP